MTLTIEQMEFLQDRGLSLADVIEFARLNPKAPRSANAERQARFRQRQKEAQAAEPVTDSVTEGVTNNVTDNATRDVTAPLSLPPNEINSNPPTHTPGNNTRARKGTGLAAKPETVSDQVWVDFQALRKRKGSPLTETALAGIADEARKAGWPLEAALKKCVVRGWQGFEADWLKGERPPSDAPANDDPLTRRLMARKAAQQEAQRA